MAAPHAVVAGQGDSSESGLILSDSSTGEVKRPQFGTRFLTDPRQVFQHNAWSVNYTSNPKGFAGVHLKLQSVSAGRENVITQF